MLANWFFAAVVATGFWSSGCASDDVSSTAAGGRRVVIHDRTPLLPHGTGAQILEVEGRSFRQLYSAGYIWIPEWDSILFLTHKDGGASWLHIFSLETKKDITIKTDGLPFMGHAIGRSKTDIVTCILGEVDGDIAVLISHGYRETERKFKLDRANKTLREIP
jgi:hypothetical protein